MGEYPAGCSKSSSSKAAASEGPRRYIPHFVWAVRPCNGSWRTEKPHQFFPPPRGSLLYVEDLNDARTLLADFFSILLSREELFGIDGRKTTELSAVAGAVQNCHLQALQRELLVPNLFECGDTEGESSLEFRGLRQPFLL
jgi:hypothetical protein